MKVNAALLPIKKKSLLLPFNFSLQVYLPAIGCTITTTISVKYEGKQHKVLQILRNVACAINLLFSECILTVRHKVLSWAKEGSNRKRVNLQPDGKDEKGEKN